MEFKFPSSSSNKSCFMCGVDFDKKTVHHQSSRAGVKDNQLVKFICELEQFFYNCNKTADSSNDPVNNNDLKRWNHLKTKFVCEECAVISQFALNRKENVMRTEQTVRQLQSKLEKEMKFLESQLGRFLKEIKSIEEKMGINTRMAINEESTEKEKVGQAVWRVIQAFKTGSGEENDIKFARPSSPPSSTMSRSEAVKVENYLNEANCVEVVMKEDPDQDDEDHHDNDDNMTLNENAAQPEMSDSDHDDQYLPDGDESDDDDDDDQSSNDGDDGNMNISSDEEESDHDQSSKQKSKTKRVKDVAVAKTKILPDLPDVLEGIDTSQMSDFKISVIRRVLQTARRRRAGIGTAFRPSKQLDPHHVANPGLNYNIDYSPEKDQLFLENINISIIEEPQGLQCSQCPYFSKRRSKIIKKNTSIEFHMDHHMFEHILGKHLKVYQCPFCDLGGSCYRNYKLHINRHKKLHKCDICGKPMANKKTIRSHKWSHMSQEEIAEAERNGKKDPRLKNQQDRLISAKPFQCSICGKSFTQKGNLKKHELQVHEGKGESKMIFCPKCGKRMTERTFKYDHKECLDPVSAIKVKCLHCPGTFKNLRLMRIHCRRYHDNTGDEETWKCGICEKEFKFKEGLKKHEVLHTGVKPYECGKGCGRKFAHENSCRRHNRVCEGFGTKPGRKR